jgi:hypothetical protein
MIRSIALLACTIAPPEDDFSLIGAAWLQTRRSPENRPPTVGKMAPPLRLLDVETGEPIVLVGLRGKVVWVIFWSADAPSEKSGLASLEPAWKSLKTERFTMVAAALESDHPDRVRKAVAQCGVGVPVFLASPESRRRFAVAETPLHVLIDSDGYIAALARGTNAQTIDRITKQAERLLEEMGPTEETRFAAAGPRSTDPQPAVNNRH